MNMRLFVLAGMAFFALSRAWAGDTGSVASATPTLVNDSDEFARPKQKDTQEKKAAYQAKLERFHMLCTADHFPSFTSLDSSSELTKGEKKKCRDRLKFLNPTME